MTRFALGVEYNGSGFHGWQVQADLRTVQSEIEKALSFVADKPTRTFCAGRTDAGVHATSQIAHFVSHAERESWQWSQGVNSRLPGDVCVLWVKPVPREFHARFGATARHYRYVILNREAPSGLYYKRVCHERKPLDVTRMQQAAADLVGEHDFSAYRASGCQAKNPVRNVSRIDVCRKGELITVDVSANAFLQHMVRNLVGVLIAIGAGEADTGWAGEVLRGADRTRGGVTAPAGGLYLTGVDYPDHFGLPASGGPPVF